MKALKVGIIGFGTVGTGVYNVLQSFNEIEIKKIAVKNLSKKRNIENFDESLLTDNPYEIVNNPVYCVLNLCRFYALIKDDLPTLAQPTKYTSLSRLAKSIILIYSSI